MFPAHLRKSPASLQDLSEDVMKKWIVSFVRGPSHHFWRELGRVRRHVRRRLPAEIRTAFLARLMPNDPWSRPCLTSPDRVRCQKVIKLQFILFVIILISGGMFKSKCPFLFYKLNWIMIMKVLWRKVNFLLMSSFDFF